MALCVPDPVLQTGDDRTQAIKLLDLEFVRPTTAAWAVLWPARPTDPAVLPTHLDVERDPIVPLLQAWLRRRLDDPASAEAAPEYPAADTVFDGRPTEPVPPLLAAVSPDAPWPLLQRAGLGRALSKMLPIRLTYM